MKEVTSVVVSVVVGVVSVTTVGVVVVSTGGTTAGEVVPQSVTVTVTVTGPSIRFVSKLSRRSSLAQITLTTVKSIEEVLVVAQGRANYWFC